MSDQSDATAAKAEQAQATAAHAEAVAEKESLKQLKNPVAPMPSTDEGGTKKKDKGDWSMI